MKTVDFQSSVEISDKNFLVNMISSAFDELDSQRQKQKADIKEVEDAIFLKTPDKFQMTDLFELYQTKYQYTPDEYLLFTILIASFPLTLIIDIAPTPRAVDIAAIVSSIISPPIR